MDFQEQRRRLRLSQVRLALQSGISRYRIWEIESDLGPQITEDEAAAIRVALLREAQRQKAALHVLIQDLEVA
jgi:hypothetical protein